jgi:Icc-related predicted phosphoesterase
MTTRQDPPQYTASRIKRLIAEHPDAGEQSVHVVVRGGPGYQEVYLNGDVATDERKATVGRLVAENFPELRLRNELTANQPPPPAEPAARPGVVCVAAVGDIHLGADSRGVFRPTLAELSADVLLLAGDLTRLGTVEEARVVAEELAGLDVPVVAVLGNHDYQSDQQDGVTAVLEDAGVTVLDGTGVVVETGTRRIGVAGIKGFGGGFAGKCATEFGEPEMKDFVRHSRRHAERLHEALAGLADQGADLIVSLTHYSPVKDTLTGEPPEIYPFLGSYQLAEAIDAAGADLAVHGHAHAGVETGLTPGGVRVRNVAQPVIRRAYAVYSLDGEERYSE